MDIISRKDAIAAGRSQYFTGKPCRNEHVTYRYVKSGTCADCLADAQGRARGALPSPRQSHGDAQTRAARNVAMSELVGMKVRAYPEDVGIIVDTAAALTKARYPVLEAGDVIERRAPTDGEGGTYLYRINCHSADVALVRDTAVALLNAHRVDLSPHLAEIQRTIAAQIDAEAAQVPEWKP